MKSHLMEEWREYWFDATEKFGRTWVNHPDQFMNFSAWYKTQGSKLTGRVIKPVTDVPARGGDFADLVKQYQGVAELQANSAAAWQNGSFVIAP